MPIRIVHESLRNLRIGYRLMLGIAAILVLTAGVAVVALMGAREPRQQLAELISDSNKLLVAVGQMRQHLLQQELLARRLSGTTNFDEAKSIMRAMESKQADFAHTLDALMRMNRFDDEQPLILEVQQLYARGVPGLRAAAQSIEAFNPDQASKILDRQVSPTHVSSLYALDQLLHAHTRKIEARLAGLEAAAARSDRAIVGISLLALALAAAIAMALTRSITEPLRQAAAFAEALGDGRLDTPQPEAAKDETGILLRALGSMATRLHEAHARLERLSTEDALTGAYNRRYFDQALHEEHQRALRLCGEDGLLQERVQLSLLMLDVDHFKKFNDRFGHQAGDACLQQVVLAVRSAASRPGDIVARYGGEEFAVILPGSSPAGAAVVAQRIRAALAEAAIDTGDSERPHVTVSIGAAVLERPAHCTPQQLIEVADAALYRAKREGRDRACIGVPAPATP